MRTKDEINSAEWLGEIPSGWSMAPPTQALRKQQGNDRDQGGLG